MGRLMTLDVGWQQVADRIDAWVHEPPNRERRIHVASSENTELVYGLVIQASQRRRDLIPLRRSAAAPR